MGQATRLLCAAEAILRRHTKEIEPLEVVLSAARRFRILRSLSTLDATVDDVNSCSKGGFNVSAVIDIVGLEETCHYVMHTRLGVLGRHIEPDTGCHRQCSTLVD
jgi:hypothetical protein